jgi:hypothetical protein
MMLTRLHADLARHRLFQCVVPVTAWPAAVQLLDQWESEYIAWRSGGTIRVLSTDPPTTNAHQVSHGTGCSIAETLLTCRDGGRRWISPRWEELLTDPLPEAVPTYPPAEARRTGR